MVNGKHQVLQFLIVFEVDDLQADFTAALGMNMSAVLAIVVLA